ncbi:PREDICTED: RING-H2 finger protein ATL2 [Ipomoea nil]|uniref:RING-H2 finger protein ATL2 n=1 Tax=Ipomoea nil TaxID=35883 RepID=UPI000901DDEE|nr:PREDICTED: RING-H2 finger protein ATL2 [Ipomoea nil]
MAPNENFTFPTFEMGVNNRQDMPIEVPMVEQNTSNGYELGGKIMLSAIVILFAVVVFIVVLHLYARWYLLRQRRRELRRRRSRNRRAQIVFYVDDNQAAASRGLEAAVIGSLPVFEYSSKDRTEPVECAVCLAEFEDNEKGRLLPKCNHSFHTECIDMWFHSHSTCPLCRSPVEAFHGPDETVVNVKVNEPVAGNWAEPGSSSGLCSEVNGPTTSSLGSRRKGVDLTGVRVEVPARNELDPEFSLSSPASCGFRSPGSRLLSLKRILSMNKRTPSGPSTPLPLSTEFDLECGGGGCVSELTRPKIPTPR